MTGLWPLRSTFFTYFITIIQKKIIRPLATLQSITVHATALILGWCDTLGNKLLISNKWCNMPFVVGVLVYCIYQPAIGHLQIHWGIVMSWYMQLVLLFVVYPALATFKCNNNQNWCLLWLKWLTYLYQKNYPSLVRLIYF